jgi:hypothetical protein
MTLPGEVTCGCAFYSHPAFSLAQKPPTCALIAHLSPTPCAFVIQTVEECERVYRELDKLLPGRVAVYTSLHKINASPALIAQKQRELGLVVSRRFTEAEFRAAQVVVTTHERWKQEIETGADLGVRLRSGEPRTLVVVDEDPSLERVFVRQPEDISQLASLFADVILKDEARAYGFASTHRAASALSAIHGRMRSIKDNASSVRLYSTDLVNAEDAAVLESVTYKDVVARVMQLPPDRRSEVADDAWGTVEFLKAAAQGRVFYSRDNGGSFYAYALMLPPQPNTLILDGTADLNGMYAIGSHVVVAESERPNYEPVDLAFVNPPAAFVGQMKPDKLLRNRRTAEPYMRWFLRFLVENTQPGERVLVYAKQRLLDYDLHKEPEYDESGKDDPYYSECQGRRIHWCHFGRGRGSNQWQDCTAYFRLGDFHMKKAVLLARIGSTTGKRFTASDLASLSSGRTRDPLLQLASNTHLVVSNKQDAARICIRHLDDDGKCKPARVYLVDCDKALMTRYRERIFPGSRPFRLIETETLPAVGTTKRPSGSARLVDLLLTFSGDVLTGHDVKERTNIGSNYIDEVLRLPAVSQVISVAGWMKATRKDAGLPGKGYVLIRSRPLAA